MAKKYNKTRIILSLIVVAAALAVAMPRTAKFAYDYKVGTEWKYDDFYSDLNFPVLKTGEQLRDEMQAAASAVIPYYRYSEEVTAGALRTAESLPLGELKPAVVSSIRSIMEKGVVSDEGIKWDSQKGSSSVIYIQKDKRAAKYPASEIWKLSDARARLLSDVQAAGAAPGLDSLLREAGVYDVIAPNLTYDRQTTELVNAEQQKTVSPTSGYVSNGQLIVRKGEIVTQEVAQMIDSYRNEVEAKDFRGSRLMLWLGNSLLAVIMVVLLFFAILFSNPQIFTDSRFFYLLTVFLLVTVGSLLAMRLDGDAYLFVPYTLSALYLQAFFRKQVITPVYTVSLLPLLVFADNGTVYFIIFLVAGLVATHVFQSIGRVWLQFAVAFLTFVVLTACLVPFNLLGFIDIAEVPGILLRLFVASMLTVAGYPLIYLFERVFNLVSQSRLRELCDTTNPLLRELEHKAPGTFQHSLQVMNMADAAARAIDSNALLVRAGALYHDIGKIANPQCFVENESLLSKNEADKYHFGLTPQQSAHDIIRHTIDGEEMARRNHLPSVIIDFIQTHHGTSLVGYFYNKALAGDGDVSELDFRYPGRKPLTKEQGILMICDSIEAASRSLTEYTPEAYSAFVEKIVGGKLEEGQLNDSDLTLHELRTVKEALKTYLAQMHHERIAYPDRNKTENKQ